MGKQITSVVFDLGGVLIDWNPRYLYRDLFAGNDIAMEEFLSTICTQTWNEKQDAGRSFADGAAELKEIHPEKSSLIDAWHPGFDKMLAGPITGTVDILNELHKQGAPLYALTNWSAETFPLALNRFDFLGKFKGIVVSGHEKVAKPDRRIFDLIAERYDLKPSSTLFIDDNPPNIATAKALGFTAIHFTSPENLRAELKHFDLPSLQRCAL